MELLFADKDRDRVAGKRDRLELNLWYYFHAYSFAEDWRWSRETVRGCRGKSRSLIEIQLRNVSTLIFLLFAAFVSFEFERIGQLSPLVSQTIFSPSVDIDIDLILNFSFYTVVRWLFMN